MSRRPGRLPEPLQRARTALVALDRCSPDRVAWAANVALARHLRYRGAQGYTRGLVMKPETWLQAMRTVLEDAGNLLVIEGGAP